MIEGEEHLHAIGYVERVLLVVHAGRAEGADTWSLTPCARIHDRRQVRFAGEPLRDQIEDIGEGAAADRIALARR